MATLNPDYHPMQHAIKAALGTHWKLFLFQGVAMLLLGILAVAAPVAATITVDLYIGWLLLFSGVVGLVAMFTARDIPAFLWSLVTAALSVIAGILLIWKPAEGVLTLTMVLTAFFVAEGIFQSVTSIAYRDVVGASWGWMLLSGISDLVLAAIIILGWPTSAGWTLGLLAGINLITSGWAVVMAALAGRGVAQALGATPARSRQ